ncbi:DUF2946 family protein [Achromobacter sp. NCFB-sbj8-Ac1-l]|uniref:DUF2946 family protein n=1 Tax=unclassified Achromobacter TaxID=2626865 RepID=UPI004046ECFE
MSQHPSVTFLRLSAAARRGVAWLAVALLVFQSLVASAAFGAPAAVARGQGASVILCTASGPRVVALDAVPPGPQADISAHAHGGWDGGGTLPHCCASTCAMLGGACPPALAGVAWRLPDLGPTAPLASEDGAPRWRNAPAWRPQQSRAPPRVG